MAKCLFFHIPTLGCYNAIEPVLVCLKTRGYEVIHYNHQDFFSSYSTHDQIVRRSYPQYGGYLRDRITSDMNLYDFGSVLLETAENTIDFIEQEVLLHKPDVIIHSKFVVAAKVVALKYGIPAVCLTGGFIFHPKIVLDFQKKSGAKVNFNHILSVKRYNERAEKFFKSRVDAGLVNKDDIFVNEEPTTVVLGLKEFQPRAELFGENVVFAGPTIQEKTFLKKHEVIYVSMGSVFANNTDFFRLCIQVFSELKRSVIISLGNHFSTDDFESIPENIKLERFANQKEILKRACLFITHGGGNSTFESIYFETPMIVIPQIIEQNYFGAKVEELGLGRFLPPDQVTYESLKSVTKEVLENNCYRDKVSEYRKKLPAAVAETVCDHIFKSHHKHSKSETDPIPATFQQQGIWIHAQKNNQLSWNTVELRKYSGTLNYNDFLEAIEILINTYDTLRTNFVTIDGALHQRFTDNFSLYEYVFYHKAHSRAESEFPIDELVKTEQHFSFDLSKGPLIRIVIVHANANLWYFIVNRHHIISDVTSRNVFWSELTKTYNSLVNNEEPHQPSFLSYQLYSKWQLSSVTSEAYRKKKKAYIERIGRRPESFISPFASQNRDANSAEMDEMAIPSDLLQKIRNYSLRTRSVFSSVFLSAYYLLLFKYSGDCDITIGFVQNGRKVSGLPGLDKSLGLFATIVPITASSADSMTLSAFQRMVDSQVKESFSEPLVFYDDLSREFTSETDGRAVLPIFNMMKVPLKKDGFLNMREERVQNPFGANNVISNHDFSIFIIDAIETVKVRIFTRVSRTFKGYTKVIVNHYLQILRSILADDATPISNFSLVSDTNGSIVRGRAVKKDNSEPLISALAQTASRHSSNVAITHNGNTYTYETLNRRSNQLANALTKIGVGRGKTVAIYMKPSFAMVQGIIAIWKAGGAYVPVRRDLPVGRIRNILNDAQVNCILTDENMGPDFLQYKVFNVCGTDVSAESTEDPDIIIEPDDLAYIIYTSGTTGTPKGVMIENGGIANTIKWRVREYNMNQNHRALQLFDYSFDGFLTSVFTPLLSGSTLHVIDEDLQSNTGFIAEYIQDHAITHFIAVPALVDSIVSQSKERGTSLRSLQIVTLAGDAVSKSLLTKIKDLNIPAEIVNEYGPTEGSVAATIQRNLHERDEITIGYPIDDTSIYILDANWKVQPVGVTGQIAMGGSGLARGYLNQPQLTTQKFIHLPGYERIYLTGDVGRILTNGQVEVSGRMDDQVKIRGFRIELGEIENEIRKHPDVNDAVVFAQTTPSNESVLCCLFVSEKAEESLFRNFLKEKLPYYMIPTVFQRVNKIPLTQNGKVDRKKLQNYSVRQIKEKLFTAPESFLEKKLARLYARALEINENEISIDDDFFYLKGHSIKAIQLLAWIEKELNVRISLREFFDGSSIKDLQAKIINTGKLNFDPILPAETGTCYPATPQQKRLHVSQEKCLAEIAHNIPVFYHIKGNLNVPEFKRAIRSVGHLYDIFKTYFVYRNGELVQCIDTDASLKTEYYEISDDKLTPCLEKADMPFDLRKAPLASVKLYKTTDANFYLLISIHHILLDGMSMPRVIDAIANQYNGRPVNVPRVTYKDYAVWLAQKLKSNAFARQRSYWQKKLQPAIPVLNIPTDYPRSAIQDYKGAALTFLVDEETTGKLDELCIKYKVTLFSLLLSVYYIVLHKYSRQEDIIVGTLNYGRNHADITDTVGLFIKTLPLRNFPVSSKKVIFFIQEVNHSVIEAFDNQDYPFESMLDDLKLPRDISRTPLFDTFFLFDSMNYRELSLSADLEILPFRVKREKTKFDIEIDTVKVNEKIRFWISYRSSLYNKDSIAILSSDILSVLRQVAANGYNQTIKDISLPACNTGRLIYEEPISERMPELNVQQSTLRNSFLNNSYMEERIQLQILLIFSEILQTEPDQINNMDSFFELGGHSMTAVRLLFKLEENFGVKIRLEDFMNNPSLDFIIKSISVSPMRVN